MIDIQKLKQVALEATQGAWSFDSEENHITSDGRNTVAQPRSGYSISTEQRDRNGFYIAAANPTAILELIDMLEKANETIAAQAAVIEKLKKYIEQRAWEHENLED